MTTNIYIDQEEILSQSSFGHRGNPDDRDADEADKTRKPPSEDYNQLDEPILTTLNRDLYGIYSKMKIIVLPLSSYDIYKVVLRGWDLWGPLLLCTFLAFELNQASSESQNSRAGLQFADVFTLIGLGSCVVSLNYRLLSLSSINNQLMAKHTEANASHETHRTDVESSSQHELDRVHSKSSFSSRDQPHRTLVSPPSTFQVMCVFGYSLVAPCIGLILLKIFSFNRLFFERLIVGLLFGFAWPTFCSVRILIRYQHPSKRALAVYPIGLFYFVLSCMIITSC